MRRQLELIDSEWQLDHLSFPFLPTYTSAYEMLTLARDTKPSCAKEFNGYYKGYTYCDGLYFEGPNVTEGLTMRFIQSVQDCVGVCSNGSPYLYPVGYYNASTKTCYCNFADGRDRKYDGRYSCQGAGFARGCFTCQSTGKGYCDLTGPLSPPSPSMTLRDAEVTTAGPRQRWMQADVSSDPLCDDPRCSIFCSDKYSGNYPNPWDTDGWCPCVPPTPLFSEQV